MHLMGSACLAFYVKTQKEQMQQDVCSSQRRFHEGINVNLIVKLYYLNKNTITAFRYQDKNDNEVWVIDHVASAGSFFVHDINDPKSVHAGYAALVSLALFHDQRTILSL